VLVIALLVLLVGLGGRASWPTRVDDDAPGPPAAGIVWDLRFDWAVGVDGSDAVSATLELLRERSGHNAISAGNPLEEGLKTKGVRDLYLPERRIYPALTDIRTRNLIFQSTHSQHSRNSRLFAGFCERAQNVQPY